MRGALRAALRRAHHSYTKVSTDTIVQYFRPREFDLMAQPVPFGG
jgi:hypothetical protein